MFLLILVVAVLFQETECSASLNTSVGVDSSTCAPWHYFDQSDRKCKCYSREYPIKCTDEGTLLKIGHCITYTENEGLAVAYCPYFKVKRYAHVLSHYHPRYIKLPDNLSHLNEYMCGPMNRKGYLCSECIEGFSPSFTSPDYMACSNCTTSRYYGVLLYILVDLVPVTLFYLLFLLLQINVTSSPMTCYIFYSQLIMLSATPSGKLELLERNTYFFQNNLDIVTYTLYGIWNFDFLRYSLPPFCVSSRLNDTQVIALGYISVIYPLCLMLLTVVLVKLHDHNFKAVVCLWRPFHKCFTRIRRGWNTKSDLINVFATVLLLSYSKLLNLMLVTFTGGAKVYSMSNDTEIIFSGTFPFTDVNYNSHKCKHCYSNIIVLIIIAGLILIVTQIPVILLTFYPLRIFQRCLSKCRLDYVHISIFVERFYSCYKDGLDGGKDFRSFAGFYFILRYLLCLNGLHLSNLKKLFSSSFSIASLIFISAAILIPLVRPYKRMYMNVLDTILLSLLAAISHLLSIKYIPAKGMLICIANLVPAVILWICFITIACRRLMKQCNIRRNYRHLAQEVTRYGSA